jgi:hypothetical protein
MRLYTVYLLLQISLHISGSDATHHQEHTQLHSQHLVLVVVSELLPPAFVASLTTKAGGSSSDTTSSTRCCECSCVCSW